MAGVIHHVFTNPVPDDPTFPGVRPSHWNDALRLEAGSHGAILFRDVTDPTYGSAYLTPAAGLPYWTGPDVPPTVLTIGSGLAVTEGALTVTPAAPLAHATTHAPGGNDALVVDAAAAIGSLRTLGIGATQAAAGDDARLSNARTPIAHGATHQAGASDPLPADLVVNNSLSIGANPSLIGAIRLPDNSSVGWINADGTAHRRGIWGFGDSLYIGVDHPYAIQCSTLPKDNAQFWGLNANRWLTGYFGAVDCAQSVSIGTTPAQSGALRLANGAVIVFRNATNDGDINALRVSTAADILAFPNELVIGQGAPVATFATHIVAKPDRGWQLGNLSSRFNNAYFGESVTIGDNPALSGAVRLPNSSAIAWRNTANTADLQALYLDNNNALIVGTGLPYQVQACSILPIPDATSALGGAAFRFTYGFFSEYLSMTPTTTPGNQAGQAVIVCVNAAGKLQLAARFPTGALVPFATEP
jgi:hypothetical protein